jgi:hypothetical protein
MTEEEAKSLVDEINDDVMNIYWACAVVRECLGAKHVVVIQHLDTNDWHIMESREQWREFLHQKLEEGVA